MTTDRERRRQGPLFKASRTLRRLLGLKPPYYRARQKLYAAITAGELKEQSPPEGSFPLISKIAGWGRLDSLDIVELDMRLEELGLPLNTVEDLMQLLEAIDAPYDAESGKV